jgi:hypothetical protein
MTDARFQPSSAARVWLPGFGYHEDGSQPSLAARFAGQAWEERNTAGQCLRVIYRPEVIPAHVFHVAGHVPLNFQPGLHHSQSVTSFETHSSYVASSGEPVSCGDADELALPMQPGRCKDKCHICNGPLQVMVWQGLNHWLEYGRTKYLANVTILNQVYVRSVEVCHRCIEQIPGPSTDVETFLGKFRVESAIMATGYNAVFKSLAFTDAVAAKIIEFLFEEKERDSDLSTSSDDVDTMPALVRAYDTAGPVGVPREPGSLDGLLCIWAIRDTRPWFNNASEVNQVTDFSGW